jgi:hypothetical protein
MLLLLLHQDAAWTLAATKSGSDTTYHGMVTGQLLLTNSHSRPLAVYSIASGVQYGPVAQVACGTPPPFQVSFRWQRVFVE